MQIKSAFGAWYQGTITGLEPILDEGGCGSGDNQSPRRTRYRCASINNAFFLRVPPGIEHDPDFCKNYDVQYALHEVNADGGGGSDRVSLYLVVVSVVLIPPQSPPPPPSPL